MDQLTELQAFLGDRFDIVRELGRGGMGIVFLAEDRKHRREVALKVLRPDLAQGVGKERFLQEILFAARLAHPNILPLLDSGEAGGHLYYVMPFVRGESLRELLRRSTQLPVDEAVGIAREVAGALQHAHALGVVHRDIKPENILMVGGHPVIADFGIARAVSEATSSRLTVTGIPLGTPTYMSPEQASGDADVDARADVYALACVLYEMLSGSPPYTGATAQAVLARKLLDPVPSLRVVRDAVPEGLERAIERGLARVPADRFSSVQAFAETLEGTGPAVRVGPLRRRPGLLAAGGAALAAVAWLGFSWAQGARPGLAPLRATVRQLTAEPGVEWFPSISPDGRWLVYSGTGTGKRDIYLRSIGGENTLNLTGNLPGDHDQPSFSPDGERIAFRSEADGGGIFVMARTGEAVRRLTRGGFSPSWSPDGTRLVYATERVDINPQNADGTSELWIVDVAAGGAQRLEGVPDGVLPAWSPSGRRIAYFGRRLGEPRYHWGVWSVGLDGTDAVPLTDGASIAWSPAWSPDGRYVYLASDRGGSMNLWRVPVDEESGHPQGDPEPVTTPATSLAHISVSRDGRHLAYSSVLVTHNVQRLPLSPTTGDPLGEPEWVTTGTRRWSSPDPSPDGRTVALYSLTQPDGDIFVIHADGTGLRQITADSAADRVPRWSPDGSWLAFFSGRDSDLRPWKIRPDGSDLTRLGDRGSVVVWSPLGDRIAVATGLPGASAILDPNVPWTDQAYDTIPAPEGSRFVPNDWSPDGARIAGSAGFGDAGILVYHVAERSLTRLTDFGQWPVWLPDGRKILFVSGGNGFYVVDRGTRQVRRVYEVERDVIGPPRLTRDGRTAYFTRRVTEADIWMVTLH